MFVTAKDSIMQLIQINNGNDCLTSVFAFMKLSICTMMLIIAELSQREKRVHNRAARGQNTKLIHEVEEMIVAKVFFSPLYMFDIIDVSNIKN